MTKAEKLLAAKLLSMAADKFHEHGCSDFVLDDTPENRKFAQEVLDYVFGRTDTDFVDVKDCVHYGEIIIGDDDLMSYFSHLLEQEANSQGEEHG